MTLFGCSYQIIKKKEKANFKKLEPIFFEWLKIHRDYIELMECGDNLYWYNERSNISAVAGAVWRRGGFAQEEFTSQKGEAEQRTNGRVDLFFHFQGLNVLCEAKQTFV